MTGAKLRILQSMREENKHDVIVVGAGLAGLSCAHTLAANGKRVLVLEARPQAGGRTSSFTRDGMAVESGLHRFIGYYSALPRLLKKCGVRLSDILIWEEEAEILLPHETNKIVLGLAPFYAPLKTLRGLLGNRATLSARDKLSLLPFFICGFTSYLLCPRRLDRFSVAAYAARHGVSERAQKRILEPLSSGIFFLPPAEYSAHAFFGLFAPAIPKFAKMRIGAFRGGMSEVMCEPILREIRSLGGHFQFGEAVREVATEKGRVIGVKMQNGQEYRARETVIATTLIAAKGILSPLTGDARLADLFALPCMSACSLQLELDSPALARDITTFGPGTDMVSFAEQSRSTFGGSRGRLSVILGQPSVYAKKRTDECVAAVVEEMGRLGVELRGHITAARKVVEENSFYALTCGSQRLRPRQACGIAGLTLAGDYTRTASFATMEGAVLSGRQAAKHCLRSLS